MVLILHRLRILISHSLGRCHSRRLRMYLIGCWLTTHRCKLNRIICLNTSQFDIFYMVSKTKTWTWYEISPSSSSGHSRWRLGCTQVHLIKTLTNLGSSEYLLIWKTMFVHITSEVWLTGWPCHYIIPHFIIDTQRDTLGSILKLLSDIRYHLISSRPVLRKLRQLTTGPKPTVIRMYAAISQLLLLFHGVIVTAALWSQIISGHLLRVETLTITTPAH